MPWSKPLPRSSMRPRVLRACLVFTLFDSVAPASEQPLNILQDAFGIRKLDQSPLLSPQFPSLSLLLVNRKAEVDTRRSADDVVLRAPGSQVTLEARFTREGGFDVCRIRNAPGTATPAEELKLIWAFPMEFNESMTLDAGALEGHPLYLPDGTIPPAHFLNWGTLFYDRSDNLAIGTMLEGAASAVTRWGRRTGPTGPTQLHFWTQTGKPDLQLTIFAYRPRDQRLWWAEWY